MVIVALQGLLMAGCKEGPKPDDVAGQTALLYYEQLLQGKYGDFVDAFHRADSIPESYRQQLIDNAKMFIAQQREEHLGIDSVRLVRAQADTARHAANAYLMLCFKDSTREEIVVPLVEHHGVWMMKH